jgi:phosphoglycolate phosphatase
LIAPNKRVVIFDLDNTLYDEFEFLNGKMSRYLDHQKVGGGLRFLVLAEFKICFKMKNIEYVIQHLNTKFNLTLSVNDYKDFLRNKDFAVDVSFYPGIYKALVALLESGFKVRLLTNGNKYQQIQKISSLSRTLNLSDKVVYAEDFAPKPDPEGINFILMQEKVNKSEVLFVGDSNTDFDCAARAQVDFMFAKDFFSGKLV